MRRLVMLIIAVVLLGCKKKELPKLPESVQLTFPAKNSECTTGVIINASSSEIEFRWQPSSNTETYELIVTNLDNGNKQDFIGLTTTSKKVPIENGTPYSWVVISMNSSVLETASSAIWNFYAAGNETTFTPFPAEILAPKMGSSVIKDSNNEVELNWQGSDLDSDIVGYDIYFSTENPPEELVGSRNAGVGNMVVGVERDSVYYWRIITKDLAGNSSDSGIFDFRAM